MTSQVSRNVPLPAKPPCIIDAKAIVAEKAVLLGSHSITIGRNTVIHPYAKLDATHGPIELGDFCIVSERSVVGLAQPSPVRFKVTVGDYVGIETGAVVESASIGKATVVGAFAALGEGSNIGKFCKVTTSSNVAKGATINDWTVVLPDSQTRVDTTTSTREDVQELKLKGQAMHIDTLRRLIPSNIAKWA